MAADLDNGALHVTLDGSALQPIFTSGLKPSGAVGTQLFPAISGCGEAEIRVNFGLDSESPLSVPSQATANGYIAAGELRIGEQVGLL